MGAFKRPRRSAAMRAQWAACREAAGCVCRKTRPNGAVIHKTGCPLRPVRPKTGKPRGGAWTPERRAGAAERMRQRSLAMHAIARHQRAVAAARAKRRAWGEDRRRAYVVHMRRVWRGWYEGTIPVTSARVRWLLAHGMWPGLRS